MKEFNTTQGLEDPTTVKMCNTRNSREWFDPLTDRGQWIGLKRLGWLLFLLAMVFGGEEEAGAADPGPLIAQGNWPGFARCHPRAAFATATNVYFVGTIAATDTQLVIADVSDPTHPRRLGSYSSGGDLNAVSVAGDYAYLADTRQGLLMVDVRNPAAVREVGRFVSSPMDVALGLPYAYVVSRNVGLEIVDVSNPRRPQTLGAAATSEQVWRVAVSGQNVFVADDTRLLIFDVTNKSSPRLLATYAVPDFRVEHISLHDNYAYLTDNGTRLQVLEVSRPSQPRLVADDRTLHVSALALVGGRAYGAAGNYGLQVINLQDPSQLQLLGNWSGFNWLTTVCANDSQVYALDLDHGLSVIDISTPSTPLAVGRSGPDLAGYSYATRVSGTNAFVADGGSGLQILDFSLPGTPRPISQCSAGNNAMSVDIEGERLYVGDSSGVVGIFNIHDQQSPRWIGTFLVPGFPLDLRVTSNLAFVAGHETGLHIYDVSDPAAPSRLGGLNLGGFANSVFVKGSVAFVAARNAGLQIIDVSTPRAPRRLGVFNSGGSVDAVFVRDGLAYLADYVNGLLVVNVRNSASPQLVGRFTARWVQDVTVRWPFAFLACSLDGLKVVDVRDPANPAGLASLDTPGQARRVEVSGKNLLLSDAEAGLWILEHQQVFAPEILRDPRSQTVTEGSNVVFSVTADSTSPMNYQWFFNGDLLADSQRLTGATQGELSLSQARIHDGGQYWAVISNPLGGVTSLVATLTVVPTNPPPPMALQGQYRPNEEFLLSITGIAPGDRLLLEAASRVTNWTTLTNLESSGTNLTYVDSTAAAFSQRAYRVRNQRTGVVAGGNAPAIVEPLSDQTVAPGDAATFFIVIFGQPPLYFLWSVNGAPPQLMTSAVLNLTNVTVSQAGPCSVVAYNNYGYSRSLARLTVKERDLPPQFTQQPEDQIVFEGTNVTFKATASGSPLPTYRWYRDLVAIPGATAPILSLFQVKTNDTGVYSCVASNRAGSATSRSVRLQVNAYAVLNGQVTDAINKKPLAGVTVSASGQSVATDNEGFYLISPLAPGELRADFDASVRAGLTPLRVKFFDLSLESALTVNAQLPGYDSYTNRFVQVGSGETVRFDFSLSPTNKGLRLVLNWGEKPSDLDAHLLTPVVEDKAYEIWYPLGQRGSSNTPPFAYLDTDKRNGFGPETITIGHFYPGTYHYFVHRFIEFGQDEALTRSDAFLQIYTAEGLVRSLRVPTEGQGDYWDVCAIDGDSGQITLINEIVAESPAPQPIPAAVSSRSRSVITRMMPSTNDRRYQWDFGDGTTSTERNPEKIYPRPGEYDVSLEVTTPSGKTARALKTQFIAVENGMPQLTISRSGTEILISWESARSDLVLEMSTEISSAEWSIVSQPPEVEGTKSTVRLSMSGVGFFRLRST